MPTIYNNISPLTGSDGYSSELLFIIITPNGTDISPDINDHIVKNINDIYYNTDVLISHNYHLSRSRICILIEMLPTWYWPFLSQTSISSLSVLYKSLRCTMLEKNCSFFTPDNIYMSCINLDKYKELHGGFMFDNESVNYIGGVKVIVDE
jgi:hypothetical protein